MITPYFDAVLESLARVGSLGSRLALPLAILAAAAIVTLALKRQRADEAPLPPGDGRGLAPLLLGYVATGLLLVVAVTALRTVQPLAREDLAWRESAEATARPVPAGPPVYQYGPSLAALVERTYTRNLSLPPEFLQRIGAEGVQVLSPYLADPSAANVLRLADSFRRSGQHVVFTREVTRLDEDPYPFAASQLHVRLRRLTGRAFTAEFDGRYTIENPHAQPVLARVVFPLPPGSTVRDLSITVGGQPVAEPSQGGDYEWRGTLAHGERRDAVVHYKVFGAGSWRYDLGSQRRRVQQFRLDVETDGPVRFLRSSLAPIGSSGATLHWELANVITAQQIGIALPPDVAGRDCYLQAVSALPAGLLLCLAGLLALELSDGRRPGPGPLSATLALLTAGFGAAAVLANYLGSVAAVILAPLTGALLASMLVGRRTLLALLPAALVPAVFLSPTHSGLLLLLLGGATLAAPMSSARHGRPFGWDAGEVRRPDR